MCATKVMVGIPGEEDYAIRIGEGVLDDLGRDVRALPCAARATRALLLTDSNVGPLYAQRAKASLAAAGIEATDVTIPAGEKTRTSRSLQRSGRPWPTLLWAATAWWWHWEAALWETWPGSWPPPTCAVCR